MKKFIAVFIGVALVLLCAAPVLAAGFSLSPAEVEFDVPADGSARVEFLVYDFGGDLEVSLENIPLGIEPEKVSVVASEEGTPIELTFYGDEALGPQVFKGKILFLASSGGNIAFGVMVKTTVNHIGAGQPLLEVTSPIPEEAPAPSPGEATPVEQAPPEEALPEGSTAVTEPITPPLPPAPLLPPAPSGTEWHILPLAGIAAGVAIIITLIVVLLRRPRY
ncbi:unnamed protein product [marine sediment metagenome]|uniref:Uncharacterized protein n=1 Tax=marine sediment metagenome TaxID=412755 RepID=X1MC54_9ZZZZ